MSTRIPKPQMKPPATKMPIAKSTSSLSAVNKNAAPTKPPPTRTYLSRKSKSACDLRQIGTKPILKSSIKDLNTNWGSRLLAQKRLLPSVEDTKAKAQKRPAAVAEDTKPKVAKVMKPAPYDYKARYNLLKEKSTKIEASYKEAKQKLSEREDYDELKVNFQRLCAENKSLSEKTEELEGYVRELEQKVSKLTGKCADLTESNTNLQGENLTLKKEKAFLQLERESVLEKNEKLITENTFLMQKLQTSEDIRRCLHNDVQTLKGNIRVFCRVRPVCPKEMDKMTCSLRYLEDDTMLEIKRSDIGTPVTGGRQMDGKSEFSFDKVFTPSATQEEVFEDLAQLVQSALDGYNVCVFAYGQTGSGKTYTMQGGDTDMTLGMIPRTIDLIFSSIEQLKKSGWRYNVEAFFLEIYNENIKDLLSPENRQQCEIRYNEGKGITVTNLTTERVSNAHELKHLMKQAQRNRAVAVTNFNEHSSRSHAVTKIMLSGHHKDNGILYTGSISLVDLAGSESAKTSSNERLVETKNINRSLSALGTVMLALYNKDSHVPFRNSKLTYLLQSSLGGNSKTLMFVNISPLEECFLESINSLRFASTVKEVKTTSRRHKVKLDGSSSMQNLNIYK